jgi:hypothetical protein
MAKEKFLILARQLPDECFPRFSEEANRAAISAGTMSQDDPYAWIEASFELVLTRDKEATHCCSFTPDAWGVPLQNYFVGNPNAAWLDDGDPEGLEHAGLDPSYYTYRDTYDPRFICDVEILDTMKFDKPLRKPAVRNVTLSRRSEKEAQALAEYGEALWNVAEEMAREGMCNGIAEAPILNVYTYRQWEREQVLKTRGTGGYRLFA